MTEGAEIIVAGGLEKHFLRAERSQHAYARRDPWIDEHKPTLFWSMLQTAETVAQTLQHFQGIPGRIRCSQPAARPPRARPPESSKTRSRR